MSAYLTWGEARELALAGTPVRRDSWATPPFWLERRPGLWVLTNSRHAVVRVVDADWFGSAEFHAGDWSTDPPGTARDACLVTPAPPPFVPPGIGLTGGPGVSTVALHADIGLSSPAGGFALDFFLDGVRVGSAEAPVPGRYTVTAAMDSSLRHLAFLLARSRLPLKKWSAKAFWTFVPPAMLVEIGSGSGWGAVAYFSAHDLTITGDGIGRADYNTFGGIWASDVMGFQLVLPAALGARDFTVDYEWLDEGGGFGRNKHGIGWWPDSAGGGDLNSGFAGSWDSDGLAIIGGQINPGRTAITAFSNHVGSFVWRNISRAGSLWRVKDGPTYPADGSYGEATWVSSESIPATFGVKMAGTHRIKMMNFRTQ